MNTLQILLNKCIIVGLFVFISVELSAQKEIKWMITHVDTLHIEQNTLRIIAHDSIFHTEFENLKQHYQTLGYLNASFQNSFSDTLITTRIDVKQKTHFIVLNFDEKAEINYLGNLNWLKENKAIIPFDQFGELKKKIINNWSNSGFPFSKIALSDYRLTKDTLFVNLSIDKGVEKKLDKIILVGYEKFPKKFIEHALDLRVNQMYNQSKIEQLSDKINQIPFVKEIKKPEIFFTQDTTYVFLFLEKLNNNTMDGIIGFSKTNTKKGMLLNGNFDIKLNNLLDKGMQFKINWISDGEKSQNFSNHVKIPYVLNTPISIQNQFELYKKDTTHYNMDEKITFFYKVNPHNTLGLNYNLFQSRVNMENNQELKNIKSNFFGLVYSYNLPSTNLFLPYKLSIENEIQTGQRGANQQWKFKNKIEYILSLSYSANLILKNETALLQSDRYYDNEVFKLGGINSIRGFRYKSVDATRYTFISIDYRYVASQSVFFDLLSDTVYLKNQKSARAFLYSIGFGYNVLIKNNYFSIKYFIGNQAGLPISFNKSFLYLNFSQNF